MILDSKTVVFSEGILNESSFNIKEQNVAHIFSILRSQLYSDKIGAIIREYVTNAIDAHVEANISKPITVTVPNGFSNEFVVRDYGFGLSQEDIVSIFASYGESTKRNSNSFTGMLGIGSKSAFAYASSFTVISRYQGIKTTYQAYIDETNVGKIAEINSEPTNESGISVHISISRKDQSQFQNTLYEFFKYIDYRPELIGYDISITEPRLIVSGNNWKFVESQNNYRGNKFIYFVMGNVTYKINVETLTNQLLLDLYWLNCVSASVLVVDVPIGKVKPTASRESLEFNQTTKEYLTDCLYRVKRELSNSITDTFNKCRSDFERHNTAWYLSNQYQDLVSSNIKKWIKYITVDYLAKDTSDYIKIKTLSVKMPYIGDRNQIPIMPNTKYIIYHSKQKITHIAQRVMEYVETLKDNTEHISILKFEHKEHMDRFTVDSSMLGAEFINPETLPFTRANKLGLKSEEADLYIFNQGYRLNIDSWYPSKSIPSDSVVYIEISSFKPKHYGENKYIEDIIKFYRNAFGIQLPRVYGVKTADLKKIVKPSWIEFKDYVSKEINQWKLNNPDKVRDYEYFKDSSAFQKELITDFEYLYHLKDNLNSYYKLCSMYFEAEVGSRKIGLDIFSYNPPKEFEAIYNRYPFMQSFQCSMSYVDKKRLINYLDMS